MSSEPRSAGTPAEVEITATFFVLAFVFLLIRPTFVVDGEAYTRQPWRTPVRFPVSTGPHTVKIFFRFLLLRECGRATVDVDVAAGTVVPVTYKAPWLVVRSGRARIGRPLAAGAA